MKTILNPLLISTGLLRGHAFCTALMLAGVGRACLLMSAGGLLALAGISTSRANVAILDQPVPGAVGGSLTIHVEAGRAERDFHVTFERDGVFYSDMRNDPIDDRTIHPHFRSYYSFSADMGETWTFDQPVAEAPGQGHGNMAVRGKWVMLVWPDIRNGAHVRYSLLHDPGVEGVGNGGRR